MNDDADTVEIARLRAALTRQGHTNEHQRLLIKELEADRERDRLGLELAELIREIVNVSS